MVLRGFENRLERMVEGTFARVFRSGLTPLEIGRRITREMDAARSAGVRGRTVVPNFFVVRLSPDDSTQFAQVESTLRRELADAARDHAEDETYVFMGPVEVTLAVDERFSTGRFEVDAELREGPGGAGAGSLILADGQRVLLGSDTAIVGRLSDCLLTFDDSNVSRHHAEIRPTPQGYIVADLGSTNGTKVNGARVVEHLLEHGDQVSFGSSIVIFEAS